MGYHSTPHRCYSCAALFDAQSDLYFRPRAERSRNGRHEEPSVEAVQPIGYITRPALEAELPFDEWVTGIVIANPFRKMPHGPEGMQVPASLELLAHTDVLVCDLPKHHGRDGHRYSYRLRGFEHAWTSDVMACQPIADWEWDPSGATGTVDAQP